MVKKSKKIKKVEEVKEIKEKKEVKEKNEIRFPAIMTALPKDEFALFPKWIKRSHPWKPTKYKPEYCQKIFDYFRNWPYYRISHEQVASAGRVVTLEKKLANNPPTFGGFALSIGVITDTLSDRTKAYSEFKHFHILCKQIQKDFVEYHVMTGGYNPFFGKVWLMNNHGLKDIKDITFTPVREKIAYKEMNYEAALDYIRQQIDKLPEAEVIEPENV